jgi:hypothetical protein
MEVGMPNLLRIVLVLLLGVHGIGHVLFLAPLLGIANWGQSTQSWLLGGDLLARSVGTVIWLVATLGFLVAAAGLFGQTAGWRTAAAGASIVSSIGLVLFWTNPTSSPAYSAFGFDLLVLLALLVLHWPPVAAVGS